jgi:Concanavalin A-like lectin/glucanases superfamily/Rhamnogalacturonan I lyases beta-sheet domain
MRLLISIVIYAGSVAAVETGQLGIGNVTMAAPLDRPARTTTHRAERRLRFEPLEERRLLSLTHLYTFNDGSANDWIGSAHGALTNGAAIVDGQLTLANSGVTSGQSASVQHVRLPAGVLPPSGDVTIEAWFTTSDAASWARVFDFGEQLIGSGNSYFFFTAQSGQGDSRAALRPAGDTERVASGSILSDGMQHMVAVVVDTADGVLRLHIDGNEASSTALAGADAESVNDVLGYLGRSLFNVDAGFTGSINELRIYDESRSATEIAAAAAEGPSIAERSPLVRQMEHLDRGVVALRTGPSQAYIGWRLFGTDPADIAFNLYRSENGGAAVKLNSQPLTQTTDFVDSAVATGLNLNISNSYFVRPVIDDLEQAPSESFPLSAGAPVRQYLNVPLERPPGGTVLLPRGSQLPSSGTLSYTYSANDASVGDLDGDGQYEIVLKWDPSNSQDNSNNGFTGPVIFDAYKLDGTLLWRIDLGRNIRAGAHYTQFLVYDFDGDGRAEVVMKTADGAVDGMGQVIGNAAADYRDPYSGGSDRFGRVLTGPEFLTVFDGMTGAALSTIDFSPPRGSISSWGDNYGNRSDRFLANVAYLDGIRPSIVMARGYYAKTRLTAYDWRDGELTERWAFDSTAPGNGSYGGQGNHNLSVGDVDFDGKDEIVYGAAVIDDNGQGLYTTGFGHGDAMHMSDMVPDRPGLEVFQIHEPSQVPGGDLRDARTGETIFSTPLVPNGEEGPGRGAAFDIDPNYPGYEMWESSQDSIYDAQGNAIYDKNNIHTNFGVWWDADLLRETLDGTTISDWNYVSHGRQNLISSTTGAPGSFNNTSGLSSNNGSKSTPALSADILGDWREEVIWRRSDNTALQIWSTTIPSTTRIYTLMHDPQYRLAIAWQNVAYNQPPHPGYFLGAGMSDPPVPQIYTVQFTAALNGDYNGDSQVNAADYVVWRDTLGSSSDLRADGDHDGLIGPADYLVWKSNFGTVGATTSLAVSDRGESVAAGMATSLPSPAGVEFASQADSKLGPSVITRTYVGAHVGTAAEQPSVARRRSEQVERAPLFGPSSRHQTTALLLATLERLPDDDAESLAIDRLLKRGRDHERAVMLFDSLDVALMESIRFNRPYGTR